jgi:hypothetical protein
MFLSDSVMASVRLVRLSAFPISARLSRANPAKFSSSASISVSKLCKREVKAAPRSQIFSEPISRKVGVLRKPLRIVEVFVTREPAVDRLPQQVGEGKLRILPSAGVCQMLLDQLSEPESLVKLAHQDQAAVGRDAGTLKIDLERGVEGELKRLVWAFTLGIYLRKISNPFTPA